MSSRLPPSKRARRSPAGKRSTRSPGSPSKQRLDANQLTITSLLIKQAKPTREAGTAPSNISTKENADSRSSTDVIIVEDCTPAAKMTQPDGESRVDRAKRSRSRESSPELFSDPAERDGESGGVLGDSGEPGECAEGGRSSGNAANAKEEVPGNQDVIVIDQDKKEGLPLPNEKSEVCYIDEDDHDSSVSSVRQKSPSITTSRSNTRSPEIDIPPWDGTPLSEICFGPSTYPILPPLQSSATHAILFRPRLKPGQPPTPFPDKFKDVWDANHVRMPCSSQSVYPVATTDTSSATNEASATKTLVPRWDIIKESLKKPIANSYDLEEAILTYNTHYAKRWNFYGLHSYFNDHCSEEEAQSFFGSVLPRVIDLALSLPSLVTHALPLLKKQLDYSVSLSQQQVACLLANAFLCTFPRRNARGATSEYASYPSINFNTLFSGSAKRGVSPVTANKLTCLFHYFTRYIK